MMAMRRAALAMGGGDGTTLAGPLPPRIASRFLRSMAGGVPLHSMAASARSILLRSGRRHGGLRPAGDKVLQTPSSRRSFAATTPLRTGPTPLLYLVPAALKGIFFDPWTSSHFARRFSSSSSSSWWWRGSSLLADYVAPPPVRSSPSFYVPLATTTTTTTKRHKHTIKTNKSASKRFRARGDGTLVRMKSGKSHNTGDKPRARKNRLGQSTTVSEPKVERKIKRVLPL